MRFLLWASLLAPAALAQRPGGPASPVYIAPALGVTAHHTLGEALLAPFPETFTVAVGDSTPPPKKTVRNCSEYLPIADKTLSTGSSLDDRTLLSLGVDCVALDWLRNARPAPAHGQASSLGLRSLKVGQLPPEMDLILSGDQRVAVRQASQQGKSLLAMEPDAKLRSQSAVRASLAAAPYWTADLTLYGRGDLLGNGEEQMLIRADYQATGGSYQAIYLYLLAPKNGKLVVVRQYPPLPAPLS